MGEGRSQITEGGVGTDRGVRIPKDAHRSLLGRLQRVLHTQATPLLEAGCMQLEPGMFPVLARSDLPVTAKKRARFSRWGQARPVFTPSSNLGAPGGGFAPVTPCSR